MCTRFHYLLSLDNDVLETSKRHAMFYNILSQNFIVKCFTKSLLIRIPKMVYLFSLIPTPEVRVTKLNRIIYKFFWKGTDKVTRLSAINYYEKGGLKMIDIECMIKSSRLAWLKRIFSSNRGIWKSYLCHLLVKYGGLFLFNCNFNVNDFSIHF